MPKYRSFDQISNFGGSCQSCGNHFTDPSQLWHTGILNKSHLNRVARAIIRLVASVSPSVRLSVGAVLFEPFDL